MVCAEVASVVNVAVELLLSVRSMQRCAVVDVARRGVHVLQELVTEVEVGAVQRLLGTRVTTQVLLQVGEG